MFRILKIKNRVLNQRTNLVPIAIEGGVFTPTPTFISGTSKVILTLLKALMDQKYVQNMIKFLTGQNIRLKRELWGVGVKTPPPLIVIGTKLPE